MAEEAENHLINDYFFFKKKFVTKFENMIV